MTALCTAAFARAACRRLSLPFPRVWSPELSVLDAEVDGERWLWHVPARAANDTSAVVATIATAAPVACLCTLTKRERLENRACPAHFPKIAGETAGPNVPRSPTVEGGSGWIHAASRRGRTSLSKPLRKATLAAWLREQEGGQP